MWQFLVLNCKKLPLKESFMILRNWTTCYCECNSQTELFCDLVVTSKEVRNNISVSVMEILMKLDGITEKWAKVKPVFSMLEIMHWFGVRSKVWIHNQNTTRIPRGWLMLYLAAILVTQGNLKQIQNDK